VIHIIVCTRVLSSLLSHHCTLADIVLVPLLSEVDAVEKLLADAGFGENANPMAAIINGKMGSVGTKTVLRLGERAVATATRNTKGDSTAAAKDQLNALEDILDDLRGDEVAASSLCEVF